MLVLICLFPLVWDLASWTVHGGKLSLNPMRHILQTETPQPIAISKNSSLAVRTDPAKRAKAAIVVLARNKVWPYSSMPLAAAERHFVP